MNNKFTVFVLINFFCFSPSAQIGYQNKRNIFSADVLINTPLFSGAYSEIQYQERSGSMKEAKERINYGYSFAYAHQLNSGFGFGAELVMKQSYVSSPLFYYNNLNSQVDSSYLRMEGLDVRTLNYQVRLEFSNKKGIAPAGIVHGIGFGYSESKIKNKAYRYSINEFGTNEIYNDFWTDIDNYYIFGDYPKLRATSISYDMTYRHPITKNLMFDIGIKYLFLIYFDKATNQSLNSNGHPIDFAQAYADIKRENFATISLKTGLSFAF